eukprot:232556-Hanusia_phi.AAC.2
MSSGRQGDTRKTSEDKERLIVHLVCPERTPTAWLAQCMTAGSDQEPDLQGNINEYRRTCSVPPALVHSSSLQQQCHEKKIVLAYLGPTWTQFSPSHILRSSPSCLPGCFSGSSLPPEFLSELFFVFLIGFLSVLPACLPSSLPASLPFYYGACTFRRPVPCSWCLYILQHRTTYPIPSSPPPPSTFTEMFPLHPLGPACSPSSRYPRPPTPSKFICALPTTDLRPARPPPPLPLAPQPRALPSLAFVS